MPTTFPGSIQFGTVGTQPAGANAVPTTRNINTIDSMAGGGDLTGDRTLSLVNDVPTPAPGQFYGYQSGARGWFTPTGNVGQARQVLTQYSLTGGGDLSVDRTHTLVNDVAIPVTGQCYGYRNGARGWFIPGMINVLDYGADPTGVADSTTAIQTALTSLASGGVLFFPPGTYLVSSALSVANTCVILGSGRYSTFLRTNSATADIIDLAASAVIRDIGFSSSATRTGGFYINFTGFTIGAAIENCYFLDYLNAIIVVNSVGAIISQCSFISSLAGTGISIGSPVNQHLQILGCTWDTGDGAIHGQTAITVTVIVWGLISNCSGYHMGISINLSCSGAGSFIQQMVIKGCFFETINQGIFLQAYSTAQITQVNISECEMAGTHTGPALQIFSSGTSSAISQIQVANCSFYGVFGTNVNVIDINTSGGGGAGDIVIIGCVIQAAVGTGNGVALNSTALSFIKIISNTISSNGGHGIFLNFNVIKFHIVGNVITANGGYGIDMQTTNAYCIVTDNYTLGNTTGGITTAPAAPSVYNNNL